jgi:hypothetical protein
LETRLPIVATDPNATAADTHADGDPFAEDPGVDNDEHSELPDPPPHQRRPFNRQGMGGNQNHHNQHYVHNDDPFAKVKFSIPPFNGSYELATLGLQPHTWDGLKTTMCQRFVPPSYQCDLCKKLQHLDQGDMSVQDYYAEL